MGYRIIVNSVGANLTEDQKAKLRKVLEDRKKKLQTALAEVEQGLRQLRSRGKKASKRKAAKRRG